MTNAFAVRELVAFIVSAVALAATLFQTQMFVERTALLFVRADVPIDALVADRRLALSLEVAAYLLRAEILPDERFYLMPGLSLRAGGVVSNAAARLSKPLSMDQILATFKIAANAAQGNRQVKVKVRGVVSNALDFLIQVPDAVKVETMGELQKIDPGPGAVTGPAGNTILTNQCGAYRTMVYQLVDKGGTAIKDQATMREIVIDTSTNQTVKDKPYDTDESGRFGDVIGLTANYPACPSVGTNINLRQTFTAKIGDKTFNLSTVRNIMIQKTSPTDWAITVQ